MTISAVKVVKSSCYRLIQVTKGTSCCMCFCGQRGLILECTLLETSRVVVPCFVYHRFISFRSPWHDISVGVAGRKHANLISPSWRGGTEEAIHVIVVDEVPGKRVPEQNLTTCNCPQDQRSQLSKCKYNSSHNFYMGTQNEKFLTYP